MHAEWTRRMGPNRWWPPAFGPCRWGSDAIVEIEAGTFSGCRRYCTMFLLADCLLANGSTVGTRTVRGSTKPSRHLSEGDRGTWRTRSCRRRFPLALTPPSGRYIILEAIPVLPRCQRRSTRINQNNPRHKQNTCQRQSGATIIPSSAVAAILIDALFHPACRATRSPISPAGMAT
jgi:hypothetical protein